MLSRLDAAVLARPVLVRILASVPQCGIDQQYVYLLLFSMQLCRLICCVANEPCIPLP
jgi:hypothetical protein